MEVLLICSVLILCKFHHATIFDYLQPKFLIHMKTTEKAYIHNVELNFLFGIPYHAIDS